MITKTIRAVAVCAVLFAGGVSASAITGSFSGDGFATVSFTNLNFCPNGQTPNGANQGTACTATTGNVTIAGGSGTFVTASGDLNTILSLNSTSEPIGSTVSVPGFVVFNPAPSTVTLTLTQVLPGSDTSTDCALAPANGQTCTPPGSAFNLQNVGANSSSAVFEAIGYATDGTPADNTLFSAIFSSQFNVPYQTVLTALSANDDTGNYSSSFSVSVSTVPEPMSFWLLGAGLIGISLIRRKIRAAR
jgi:PEP-CTERM motif-containing protein